MKRILIALALIMAALATTAFVADKNDILEIGAKAPKSDMKMEDISGKIYALDDLKRDNGLLVIFSCNTCPFVVGNEAKDSDGWQGRYNDLHKLAGSVGIGMVLINSNEAYRNDADSKEAMLEHARSNKYSMQYLIDKDHILADEFGALTTPHVFLFDSDLKLVYKGAIDDNVNDASAVKEPYLQNAMKNLSRGQEINPNSTRQLGCSIKRNK